MSAVAFHCENPDFTVQSVPDGDLFGVRRDCLIRGSEVLPEKDFGRIQEIIPEATIPFPLLPSLYRLADKYAFSQDIMQALHSHLGAYVSMYPLRVYGYASELGLDKVAAKASTHLLHPPLTSYSTEEMKAIPTAEAYHKLALLHEFRTRKIRETLMNEEVFPHGYGECSRHAQRTKDLWKTRKHVVYNQIQAGETLIIPDL
ncbi:hypothetical protein PHLCEN_2v12786 [Hermanssonia centrifuga]|uniref:Uncharacterized protein n=1 Tax=Hermanssonia centrifuga TaxID=98765 RepID=A0A2R6NH17_9APHY|nr:hypothetical protein PHLCEN_2v12786 [Hermanssonia centrifuga]